MERTVRLLCPLSRTAATFIFCFCVEKDNLYWRASPHTDFTWQNRRREWTLLLQKQKTNDERHSFGSALSSRQQVPVNYTAATQ